MSTKRFRIAFSFAGEKRDFVAKVAAILAKRFGESAILYDKFHEAEFARYDLGIYLPKLYRDESDLVVAVLCPDYDQKIWTGWEWMAIYAQFTKKEGSRVMLTRFEHAQGDGLFDASAFVELDHRTPEQAADLILQRLALNEGLAKEHYLTAASEMKGPIRDLVYISYSHSDKVWQKKLRRVLDADPELRGLVWDDTKIAASVPFERDITDHVKRARVMVMLLSENYFRPNSGAAFYETLPALEAHKRGEMDILWVPVKAHDYRNSPVGHIMAATGAGAAPLESLPASTQKKSLQRVQQEVRRCLGLPKIITHEKRIAARSSRVASTNPLHSPPAESMHTMNTQETVPAIAGPKPPIPNAKQSPALKRWMDKLEFLQEQLAISASPAQKFELKSQIDEAKEKIVELGGQASQ